MHATSTSHLASNVTIRPIIGCWSEASPAALKPRLLCLAQAGREPGRGDWGYWNNFQGFSSHWRNRGREGKRNTPKISKSLNVEHSLPTRKPEQVNNSTWQAARRLKVAHFKCRCYAAQKTKTHQQYQVKYESSYLASQIENLSIAKSRIPIRHFPSLPSLHSHCPCSTSGPYYLLPAQGHLLF